MSNQAINTTYRDIVIVGGGMIGCEDGGPVDPLTVTVGLTAGIGGCWGLF